MADAVLKNSRSVDELLLDLIYKYYQKHCEKLNENDDIKIGDLLKMIELHRKIQPADSSHKQFWKMIDRIRKENESKPVKSKKKKVK